MRTFHIDFLNPDNSLPDGNILGNQGEHNATVLTVTPPAEMTANEKITSYRIAFELTNCRSVRSGTIAKSDVISLPLFSQITSSETVAVQLEGYDGNGEIIIKSPKIKKLKFNPSVCGIEISPSDSPNSMAAEVTANTSFRNKFSEDENGGLLYDGKSIKRPYETIECETVIFAMQIENKWVIGAYSELPVKGVEIKTVRIRTADYGDVDLRFMGNVPGQSSYPSYALNFCTLNSDDSTGFSSTIAIIEFTYGANDIIQAISNYDVSYFEIDYYTD